MRAFFSCLIFYIDNLLIDYQFTFSLIQEDDNHYTAINFMASPEQVTISENGLIMWFFFFLSRHKKVTQSFWKAPQIVEIVFVVDIGGLGGELQVPPRSKKMLQK